MKRELTEEKRQEALKISIKEGSANSASSGFGDSFIVPFAQVIGANAIHIGIISAFSNLLSPLSQQLGNKLMEKHSRKKIAKKFVLFQAFTWLLILPLIYLFWKDLLLSYLPWLLIVIYALIAIFSGLVYPSWFSWMGDLVKDKEKGRYFSKRNIYTGLVGIVVSLSAAAMMEKFKVLGLTLLGFSILFLLAFVFRTISYTYIKKEVPVPFKLKKKSEFSFISFLKRYDNFGKFAVYQALFNFAIMIASPFFGFYMLTELGLNNNLILFMLITVSSSIFSLMILPLSGKFSDKYGNLKLMYIANTFFVLTPLLWLFSKNPLYLILVPGLSSGIANAALTISFTNYTYDSVSHPENRGTCISYVNLLVGVGGFIGSILGGILIKTMTSFQINSFLLVFILAALTRLLVGIFFLPNLKEVKKVKKMDLTHMHPLKTIHHEISGFGVFTHHLEHNFESEIASDTKIFGKRAMAKVS